MPELLILVEIAVLIAAATPLVRLLALRPLQRLFPRLVRMAAAVLVLAAIVVGLIASRVPGLLHPLAAAAAIAWAFAAWRGRSAYGRSRRLPPGSLSLTASVEAIVDREFYRKQAALHGPIFKMAQIHQPVVCVVGLPLGHRLLREHEDVLGPATQPFNREVNGGFLRFMEGETYKLYGPLFRVALSAPVMAHARVATANAVRRALTEDSTAAARGGARSFSPERSLKHAVDAAFVRALFGADTGTPAFAEIMRAYQPLAPLALSDAPTPAMRASLDEFRRVLRAQHAALQRRSGQPVPVCTLTELHRADARMPDATCIDNLIFIFKISTTNVVGLLRWLLVMLGQHPEWIARARAVLNHTRPGPTDAPPLVDRIIMETLRLSQSEYLYRRLGRDVEFEGFVLPKGLVRICVWESHRNGDVFDDPDRFDPDRFLGRERPRSEYSPFGAHQHACNGVPLTYLIGRTFIEELTRHYDWAVEGHEQPERDFRHWSHWRPSSALRLRLTPIAAAAVHVPQVAASGSGRAR